MTNRKDNRNLRNRASARIGKLGLAICCLVGLGAPLFFPTFAVAQPQQQPAKARVAFFSIPVGVAVAPIFATASENSYQTGSILKDRYVEVYFKTEDGFCAIRPPYGSFSWINGKFVQMEDESNGRVHSPSGKLAPSRVGVESPTASKAVQVGLRPNQKIKVLGKVRLDDGTVWYKISPPPGEFRWIKASSLVQDPALDKLPNKLTLQEDFLKQFENTKSNDADQTPNPPTAQPLAPEQSTPAPKPFPLPKEFGPILDEHSAQYASPAKPVAAEPNEFQNRLDSLNRDVAKIVGRRDATPDEFHALRARVGELRALAKDDSQRFVVSAVAESIAKAENANALAQKASRNAAQEYRLGDVEKRFDDEGLANNSNQPEPIAQFLDPPGVPIANNAEIAGAVNAVPDGRVVDGKFFPNVPAPGLALDASGLPNGRFVNGNFIQEETPGLPTNVPLNAQNVVVASPSPTPVASAVPTPHETTALKPTPKKDQHKSRLEFAFSGDNSPFRREKEAILATNVDRTKKGAALARLPSLLSSGAQIIVPPASYDMQEVARTTGDAKLQTGLLRRNDLEKMKSEVAEATINVESTTSVEKPRGALVFKAPNQENADQTTRSPENSVALNDPNASPWKPVERATSHELIAPLAANRIALASGNASGKVRQTGSFAPATSKSFEHFDSSGTLVELSNASEGAPKYALLAHDGTTLTIVAYLQPDRNVSFSQFIGQKVGVKGTSGTVEVDGTTKKLIIVKSLFLQK